MLRSISCSAKITPKKGSLTLHFASSIINEQHFTQTHFVQLFSICSCILAHHFYNNLQQQHTLAIRAVIFIQYTNIRVIKIVYSVLFKVSHLTKVKTDTDAIPGILYIKVEPIRLVWRYLVLVTSDNMHFHLDSW